MIAPTTPPPPISNAGSRSTLPRSRWLTPPTIAVGMMATSEVPWATAWDSFRPTVIVGTNSSPPPMPMVPLRKPAPNPPKIATRSPQLKAPAAPHSWKQELLQSDHAEHDRHRELELPVRNPAQQRCAQVGTHDAADDEEQGAVKVDLRRALPKVVDRRGREGDRDARDERVGVGVALGRVRPQHLQRDQDKTAPDAKQPAEHAAQ